MFGRTEEITIGSLDKNEENVCPDEREAEKLTGSV
jgi:hypothetical protein